jgi:hypothetical protein
MTTLSLAEVMALIDIYWNIKDATPTLVAEVVCNAQKVSAILISIHFYFCFSKCSTFSTYLCAYSTVLFLSWYRF